uniref:Uncharacterized protein n=1 Tax=Helianthus annuus TaxID=4232 RepID=A0A251TDY5_HELAN
MLAQRRKKAQVTQRHKHHKIAVNPLLDAAHSDRTHTRYVNLMRFRSKLLLF